MYIPCIFFSIGGRMLIFFLSSFPHFYPFLILGFGTTCGAAISLARFHSTCRWTPSACTQPSRDGDCSGNVPSVLPALCASVGGGSRRAGCGDAGGEGALLLRRMRCRVCCSAVVDEVGRGSEEVSGVSVAAHWPHVEGGGRCAQRLRRARPVAVVEGTGIPRTELLGLCCCSFIVVCRGHHVASVVGAFVCMGGHGSWCTELVSAEQGRTHLAATDS